MLENAPCDKAGHQSPHPTFASFPLFSYVDFRGKAVQMPSYLYTAQWPEDLNQNCSTDKIFPDQPLLVAISSSQVMAPRFCSSPCSPLSSKSLIHLRPPGCNSCEDLLGHHSLLPISLLYQFPVSPDNFLLRSNTLLQQLLWCTHILAQQNVD